jgi:serine/threonine protein kinase
MTAEPSPTVVGRYALFDRIAAGGTATVHLGRLLGEAGFTRIVAIKRLHAQFALDPEFVSMFLDEARLCARIRHPNVVPSLDVVARDGELFLVMEYVEGESLASLLYAATARGERPAHNVIASVMAGVLHGLHAAHEAKGEDGMPLGIVHRDVSPQNVLVGVDGIARVLDFGVAKALGQIHTTRQGSIKGKLSYMAPEQLLGDSVTRRADVFAASIVLWEALSMQRLFRADNEARRMHMIVAGHIPALGEVVPDVPEALARVVMRGLERDPAKRYETALDMAEALEGAVLPATPRAVGAWVRELSQDRLSRRAALVSEVESGSSRAPDSEMLGLDDPGLRDDPTLYDPGSQVSGISVSGPVPGAERSPLTKRGVQLLAGLATTAAIVGGVALWSHRRSSPAPSTAAVPVLAASLSVPVSSVTPAPAPAASATPPTAGVDSSAPKSAATAPAVTAAVPARATAPQRRASPVSPAPSRSIYSRD